jgi:hypothetical protein
MLEHFDELTIEMNKYNAEKKRQKKLAVAAQATTSPDLTVGPTPLASKSAEPDHSANNKKVRVQAMKRVTKKHVEVYVSFD